MRDKRLIVNADDLGMSHGITDGIFLAHRYGLVTSASLMANMPAAEYAAARLAKVPRLGVGAHLNICAGRPLLSPKEIPSLVGANGRFHTAAVMIHKLWTWGAAGREIEAEFRAQIRWMKDRGVVPTHADSHRHMHIYPAAVAPFRRALAAEGISCARALRASVWPRGRLLDRESIGGPHEGPLVRRLSVQAYRGALQWIVFRKLDMPDGRVSFLSRDRHDLSVLGERWKAAIENLPAGTFELACHPGLFERGFSEADAIRTQREEELRWLTNRDLCEAVDRSGVRLITYRDLLASAAPAGPVADPAAEEAPAL
jgi:predicted glycoside hydrolase/deacetylase ChbG (UPF0249 family)